MSRFTTLMTSRRSLNVSGLWPTLCTILPDNDFVTISKRYFGLWPTLGTILHN